MNRNTPTGMSKCQQGTREFITLRSLSKEEFKTISDHKDSMTFKNGEVLFCGGNTLNGVYCIRRGVC